MPIRIGLPYIRAPLLVGVVITALAAGVGLAVAGEGVVSPVAGGSVDPEAARETLIDDVMNSPPPGFGGASFEIDESAGRVVARYFFAEAPGVVPAVATGLGDLVQASAEAGELGTTMEVSAGHTTYDGRQSCTLGWAVDIVDGPNPEDRHQGMMTAGHCFKLGQPPGRTAVSIRTAAESTTSATGVTYTFGSGGDYGYLRLKDEDVGVPAVATPVGRKLVREIGDPVVGDTVCKFGRTTKETCGVVERVDVSTVVNHGNRRALVEGMARTSYCGNVGDSGGPVYASYTGFGATDSSITAIGVHSSVILYNHAVEVPGIPVPVPTQVCGEEVGRPNEAYFTPLSNIGGPDRFFVKIAGG